MSLSLSLFHTSGHDPAVGRAFFRVTKQHLDILDNKDLYLAKQNSNQTKHEHIWHSKYGNVRKILRLDRKTFSKRNVEAKCVEKGQVPLSITVYSILVLAYEPTKPPNKILMPAAIFGACICPVIRSIQFGSQYAFGASTLAKVLYALRTLWFFCMQKKKSIEALWKQFYP